MFSVIVPLYNKQRHIKRTLESILYQSFDEFEILVINDGSTDESLKEVESIDSDKIKTISQKNQGVSVARNNGIKSAKYPYIAFLDADDTWEVDFLKEISLLINDYPTAGMYCSAYNIIYKDTKKLCKSFSRLESNFRGYLDDYFKYAIDQPIVTASSVVIPKNVFDNIGNFKSKYARGEDLDMWTRIALNYKVAYTNLSLANYHKDSDNMATLKKFPLERSSVFESEEMLLSNNNSSVYYKEYMIKSIYIKARYLINEGNSKKARKLLRKYRKTKLNKKLLFKTYLYSYIKKLKRG